MLASILAREMEAFSFQRSALSFRSSAVGTFDFGRARRKFRLVLGRIIFRFGDPTKS
jgi:hypothetical protein